MTWIFALVAASAGPVPSRSTQMLLVVAPDADGSVATLQRAERNADGWHAIGAPMPARVGAAGVAWGLGLHPAQPGLQKVEGDLRSPMGVFLLGDGYRDTTVPPIATEWPLVLVGPRDLWVEDPKSAFYNAHIVVPGDRPLLPWEEAARMTLEDPALALKVFVLHNPVPAVPGAGSAIFLHGHPADGELATAGCTALGRTDLETVIRWLRPRAEPVFVLLATRDLARLGPAWSLPGS